MPAPALRGPSAAVVALAAAHAALCALAQFDAQGQPMAQGVQAQAYQGAQAQPYQGAQVQTYGGATGAAGGATGMAGDATGAAWGTPQVVTDAAGTAGAVGAAGTAATGGDAGYAGTATAAGTGGYAGTYGTAGNAGTYGAAGTYGTVGTGAGAVGTAGTAGATAGAGASDAEGGDDGKKVSTTTPYDPHSTTTITITGTPPPLPTVVMPGTLGFIVDSKIKASNQTLKYSPWRAAAAAPCTSRFVAPTAPHHATDLNGVVLAPVCFTDTPAPHHVFIIGDWGGISTHDGMKPKPADHRSKIFPAHHRPFIVGADDTAQQNVAKQMAIRAPVSKPEYIINVGDNFYWGGVQIQCGAPVYRCKDATGQWRRVFEDIYHGPHLDGKQWLGILGNHDYGGYIMTNGWDQAISYTWAEGHPSTDRWMTPALYWAVSVRYGGFSVDYFFVDSNVFDSFEPHADQHHNICSIDHNPHQASCGLIGPISIFECPKWFKKLWDAQVDWLHAGLRASRAEWQVVVTHFPPEHGKNDWQEIVGNYGVDLLITGHRHQQEVHAQDAEGNFLAPTAYVVSGGGGGITSEGPPKANGADDQYGFMDMTMTKTEIKIEAISHGGQIRSTTCVTQRGMGSHTVQKVSPSMCDGVPSGPQPLPGAVASPWGDETGGSSSEGPGSDPFSAAGGTAGAGSTYGAAGYGAGGGAATAGGGAGFGAGAGAGGMGGVQIIAADGASPAFQGSYV